MKNDIRIVSDNKKKKFWLQIPIKEQDIVSIENSIEAWRVFGDLKPRTSELSIDSKESKEQNKDSTL